MRAPRATAYRMPRTSVDVVARPCASAILTISSRAFATPGHPDAVAGRGRDDPGDVRAVPRPVGERGRAVDEGPREVGDDLVAKITRRPVDTGVEHGDERAAATRRRRPDDLAQVGLLRDERVDPPGAGAHAVGFDGGHAGQSAQPGERRAGPQPDEKRA